MHTDKKGGIYIVITILVIVGVFLLLKYYTPKTRVPVEEPIETIDTTTWQPEEVEKKEIKDSGQGYEITVFYPKTNSAAVTKYMEEFATDAVAQFKNDIAWVTDPLLPKDSSSVMTTLSMDYQGLRSSAVQNYIFTTSSDTGGAHPMSTTATFSFLKSGEYITIENLFTDTNKGLKALADFSIAEIKRRNISDDSWITDGAGAKAENYKSFTIGDEGVTVYFDPYQVAAYVAGIQKVTVPFSVLKAYLNPDIIFQ